MTGQNAAVNLAELCEDNRSDKVLLGDLIARNEELSEAEQEAFSSMLNRLIAKPETARLTTDQRKWAEDAANRLGISFSRRWAERAQNVPRGREVKMPDVLSKDALHAALVARRR